MEPVVRESEPEDQDYEKAMTEMKVAPNQQELIDGDHLNNAD